MDTLMNYFFPETTSGQTHDADVSVCMTRGDTMTIVRLSDVKRMTDTKDLYKLGQRIAGHLAETFDSEESYNAGLILEEIEKKLSVQ